MFMPIVTRDYTNHDTMCEHYEKPYEHVKKDVKVFKPANTAAGNALNHAASIHHPRRRNQKFLASQRVRRFSEAVNK
jgi:hypothetical protein